MTPDDDVETIFPKRTVDELPPLEPMPFYLTNLPNFLEWRTTKWLPRKVQWALVVIAHKCEMALCKLSKRYRKHYAWRGELRAFQNFMRAKFAAEMDATASRMFFAEGSGWQ